MKNKVALVLGATGGVGGEVARRLLKEGWNVKGLIRKLDGVPGALGIDWITGDAMNAADVIAAASGVDVIVHAVNPPGYRNWAQLVLPMIDNTIQAAKKSGARILLPGTIYNYGKDASDILTEQTPQNPHTRKGLIRKELEQHLFAASQEGVRVLIVRCGDFYGPRPGNNWFSQGLIKPGAPIKSISYPGRRGVGHAWAYLPDVAETVVQLLNQESRLGLFETFHFEGHWDHDGRQMIQAIERVTGASVKVAAVPWFVLKVLSPFVVLFREMSEMRYLWDKSYRLDNQRLKVFLGSEPKTSIEESVRATLKGLGCL